MNNNNTSQIPRSAAAAQQQPAQQQSREPVEQQLYVEAEQVVKIALIAFGLGIAGAFAINWLFKSPAVPAAGEALTGNQALQAYLDEMIKGNVIPELPTALAGV